jgi:hypothetical protein
MSLRRDALSRVQFRVVRSQPAVNKSSTSNDRNVRVPLFGDWRNAYLSVVVVFILEVALFYFLSRYFS